MTYGKTNDFLIEEEGKGTYRQRNNCLKDIINESLREQLRAMIVL